MQRVENISEKFISYLQKTFDKINPNHIRCIVSEADMNENFLISGSAVLGFCMELLDSKISFKPRDLDIFIDYQKHQDIKFYIHRFSTLLKQEFQKTNNYLEGSSVYTSKDGYLQFIFVNDAIGRIHNFDIDICSKYYNSFNIFSKTRCDEIEFNVTYDDKNFERTQSRVKKYINYGFRVKDTTCSEEIVTCKICHVNMISKCFPCGHMTCSGCLHSLVKEECPICRKECKFNNLTKLYF